MKNKRKKKKKNTKEEENLQRLCCIWDCVVEVHVSLLTLKAPITTAADDIHKYIFIVIQRE